MRLFFAICLILLPGAAGAQGWIEPFPRPRPLPAPQAVPRVERVRTSVTVRITDRVARVQVEEWFRNAGSGLGEGDYIYPLPGDAVFSDFSLLQGEEELEGEMMDAPKARAIYEEIVRRHRDPALIELAGHGLIRARIFPIPAGQTRSVTLRYTQVLARAGDAYRFRYAGSTSRRPAAGETSTAVPDDAPISFTLVSDSGQRFGEPFSPTHRLRTSRDGQRLTVRPDGELRGTVDVFLPLAGDAVGVSLATHRVDGEAGYFMLTLSPARTQAASAPRDIAVVVDTSGSMSGEKIEQARQALHRVLGTLNTQDRFRLISFSNAIQSHAPTWTPASRAAIDGARTWVDNLVAAGGTNIAGALDEAFRTPGGDGRLHLVIFVTDGLPTVGETNPDRIAAKLEAGRGNARIFTFGVGYDLQTYLLERMATAGRGSVDYVQPGQDVEEAVGTLAAKITHPVLVDLAFGGAPVRLTDVQPSRLPDLFAGDELVVFGRYEGTASGELVVNGMRNGRREQFSAQVDFPARSASGEYIASLWAARRIGELMRTIRVEGETPERIAEVRALALRYGLLSEYTSYLVQEPNAANAFRGGIVPAAAPVAATGAAAVQSARLAAVRREAQTALDLKVAEQAANVQLARPGANGERAVSGRRFRLDAGVWTDAAHTASVRVLHVEPFSAAYFELVDRLPELRPYLNQFAAVTVAGGRLSIRVAAGGRATIPARELATAVVDFRAQRAR